MKKKMLLVALFVLLGVFAFLLYLGGGTTALMAFAIVSFGILLSLTVIATVIEFNTKPTPRFKDNEVNRQ